MTHAATARSVMHGALAGLCRTRADEAAYAEWIGAHPLDAVELTGGWMRDRQRAEVRKLNARAGRRTTYVCGREDRARTKSTAQLRYERDEVRRDLLTSEADPAARRALAESAAKLRAVHAELEAHPALRASGIVRALVRRFTSEFHARVAAALATCRPAALRELARAEAALAARLAETARARAERLEVNAPEPLAAADLAPRVHTEHDPPPVDPDVLTRRANLTVRPTIERLTRTLALAPGAPSLAASAV